MAKLIVAFRNFATEPGNRLFVRLFFVDNVLALDERRKVTY